jgi:hypothetical protein
VGGEVVVHLEVGALLVDDCVMLLVSMVSVLSHMELLPVVVAGIFAVMNELELLLARRLLLSDRALREHRLIWLVVSEDVRDQRTSRKRGS